MVVDSSLYEIPARLDQIPLALPTGTYRVRGLEECDVTDDEAVRVQVTFDFEVEPGTTVADLARKAAEIHERYLGGNPPRFRVLQGTEVANKTITLVMAKEGL